MIAFDQIQQFIIYSRQESSVEALADHFAHLAAAAGFEEFIVCSICDLANLPPDAVWINRYSPAWTQNYLAHCYCEIDPIFTIVPRTALPFAWDEVLRPDELSARQQQWLRDERAHGHLFGLTVPIHNSGPYAACVSLAARQPFDPRAKGPLHLLSIHLFEAARRAMEGARGMDGLPSLLTRREAECLIETAMGKTLRETAMVVGVSEATVRFHLENIRRKYGATTTAQAVATALRRGDLKL